ncbi:hypothetical protein NL676_037171 [Syzygium grande]|nr:hypothetical protein NL676_037171 [Syzygium grande]
MFPAFQPSSPSRKTRSKNRSVLPEEGERAEVSNRPAHSVARHSRLGSPPLFRPSWLGHAGPCPTWHFAPLPSFSTPGQKPRRPIRVPTIKKKPLLLVGSPLHASLAPPVCGARTI